MSPLRTLSESLGEKLERLCERLSHLGAALREELAREVGATTAEAVRAAVRRLLDGLHAPAARPPGPPAWNNDSDREDDWPDGRPDPGAPEDDWGRDDTDRSGPRSVPHRSPGWGRWRFALTAAWQAAAGLWRRGQRLTALAAAGAGLAAGLLAAPSGTTLAAGAAAATTALALVAISDAARRAVHLLARWAAPARL
jgi:hypothetical protein